MVGFSHSVIDFIWVLAVALSGLVATLAGFLLVWRAICVAASRRARKLSDQLQPWVEDLLDGSADYETALGHLCEHPKSARQAVVDRLALPEVTAGPDRIARLRRVCADLGLVALWRRQLSREPSAGLISGLTRRGLTPIERIPSLSFVARSEAAENLGLIRDRWGWPLLAKMLNDPNLAVRSVAARALGRIQPPASFPMLMRKLQDAAMGTGRNISVRSLKMTLASFPLAYASDLSAMLQHPHRRVRFLAADVIATMVQRSGAPEHPWYVPHNLLLDPVAEIFLAGLVTDENPDVRARAADVIVHLDDARAMPALLTLLEDAEWFVRLHAARALANCTSLPLGALGSKLEDSNWRVREAAAQALAAHGERGVRFLLAHFRATNDRYSREQVAEQIERLGLIPSLVAAFGATGAKDESQFIEGMVRPGRTASLRAALQNAPEHKRRELLTELQKQGDLANNELSRPSAASTGTPPLAIPGGGHPRSGA